MVARNNTRPTKLWWLIGLLLLGLCLFVQLPARWLVEKFVPNNPYLQQVSGNLWHGQANWQIALNAGSPLTGTTQWQWQPWYLLSGKLAMVVTVETGKSQLIGQVKVDKNSWQIQDFSGKITADTLKKVVQWQLPDTPIQIKDLSLARTSQGYQDAKGNLSWVGGELAYPMGGKNYHINLPYMSAVLGLDAKASASGNQQNLQGQRVHLALTNQQGQRLGDLYLDNDNMLDVAFTKRFLKNMPAYKGQGADDTVVVSLRQPLSSLGK